MVEEGRVAHMNPADARFAEMVGYFPAAADYQYGPDEYVEHIHRDHAGREDPRDWFA